MLFDDGKLDSDFWIGLLITLFEIGVPIGAIWALLHFVFGLI